MMFDNWLDKKNKELQKTRAKVFRPICKVLTKLKIQAFHITNFRTLLAFAFLAIFFYDKWISFSLIIISLLLDIFDGPLARYQKKDSDKGKFLDTFNDTVSYSIIIIALIFWGANWFVSIIHIISTLYGYVLAIIYKNEGKESDWIIRPAAGATWLKILPTCALFLNYFNIDIINISIMISMIMSVVWCFYYYRKLQNRWFFN